MSALHDPGPWSAPGLEEAEGRFVRLERFSAQRHADALWSAISRPEHDLLWRFIPVDRSAAPDELADWLGRRATDPCDPWETLVIRSASGSNAGAVLGMASYMRIRPVDGSAEAGAIVFGPDLQRTPGATEAMLLMARHVFEARRYRRYEWKCDDRNAASMRAAERLGFTFEGVFRQDRVMKGENRNTAWFSILDREWPACGAAMERWLAPENFDAAGRQRRPLQAFREEARPHGGA